MNSNIEEITNFILKLNSQEEAQAFLKEMLSGAEMSALSKRWRILSMLAEGRTQRDIVKELKVSLCKVTRGSKLLKDKNSVITKYFMENSNYGNNND